MEARPRPGPTTPWLLLVLILAVVPVAHARCPWDANLTALHAGCSCAVNLGQQLTVHCSLVNLSELVGALRNPNNNANGTAAGAGVTIALLYLTNGTVGTLENGTFDGLRVVSLQLVQCGLTHVQEDAFVGLNETLTTLGLPNNALQAIPRAALQRLHNLVSLDLTRNRIAEIPDASFAGLHLHVLKMGGNRPLLVHARAFAGLETTLRNLNLQDTGQTRLPDALANLSALALLDLGQNMLVGLDEGALSNLNALTALNLERNPIGALGEGSLVGVKETLSSLSLLSNVLVEFPTLALQPLKHLRVLDLGFNQIASVPDDAFSGMGALTLLALDGNPLNSLQPAAFLHLNHSLRGLSIGGKALECDCRLRWISEWIRDYDLQVTSRERNPHFCGKPPHLVGSNLMQLQPDQLRCPDQPNTTTSTTAATTTTTELPSTVVSVVVTSTEITHVETELTGTAGEESISSSFLPPITSTAANGTARNEGSLPRGLRTDFDITSEQPPPIAVARIAVEDSTVHVEWEATGSETGSVRVAYRLFGEEQFKVSRSLSPFDRQLAISNVPDNECLIVCLLHTSDDDDSLPLTITIDTLPAASCREVRTRRREGNDADKVVIIAASAAICAAILIAVVIFVCCNRQRLRKEERQMPMPAGMAPHPVMDVYKPTPAAADWDTASVYSTRSIPRAQMYHGENGGGTVNSSFLLDDHLIHLPPPPAGKVLGRRPYSAMGSTTGRLNHYPMGRPENNRSSHSLAAPAHSTMTGGALYKKRTRHKRANMAAAGPFHSLRGFDPDDSPHLFKNDRWTDQELESYAVIKGHPSHMPLNHGFP